MPFSWQEVVYTPPICIAIRLPFVSRCSCRSIRVRGCWNTPNERHEKTGRGSQKFPKIKTFGVLQEGSAERFHSKKPVEERFCKTLKVLQNFGAQAQLFRSWKFFFQIKKTREGCNSNRRSQKAPRTEGGDKVQGSVDPRFPAGLPFPVPEILELRGFRDSGKFSSSIFPGIVLQYSSESLKSSIEAMLKGTAVR